MSDPVLPPVPQGGEPRPPITDHAAAREHAWAVREHVTELGFPGPDELAMADLLLLSERVVRLVDEVTDLKEWIASAHHHPGCSGGFGNYRCKCGRREIDLPWGQDAHAEASR